MTGMKRRSLLLVAASATLLFTVALAQDHGVQSVIGNVFLQNTSPGEAQIGHANIKGTFRAGQVNVVSQNATIPVIANNNATDIAGVGGSFSSAGPNGIALRGTATNLTGVGKGVYGESRSDKGYGVEGFAQLDTGVRGGSNGAFGIGVLAVANRADATALFATSTSGRAAVFSGTTQQYVKPIEGFNIDNEQVYVVSTNVGGSEFRCIGNGTGNTALLRAISSTQLMGLIRDSQMRVQAVIPNDGIGRVNADVKNFVQPDPDNVNRNIVYACVEGPEAAAYIRGTSRLVNGRATVSLPAHFRNVAVAEGMTIQLTPLDAESKGMAVVRKSLMSFEVRELWHGTGAYEFDWEVKAVRRGFTDYQVYRPWDENLPSDIDRNAAIDGRVRSAKKVYGITYQSKP